MTDTKPIYIRAGKATLDKFTELVKLYGSQTQVFAVAIEYLYQREVNRTHPAPQPGGRVGERGGEMTSLEILLTLRENATLEVEKGAGDEYTVNFRDGKVGGFCCGGRTLHDALREAETTARKYIDEVTT